jgi:hypothetical protein
MSRAYYWIAEVQKAVRTVIGDGLKQQLEAPQDLPPDMASLVARIGTPDKLHARDRLSMTNDDRVACSSFGRRFVARRETSHLVR